VIGIADVGHYSNGIGTSAISQVCGRSVEVVPRTGNDCDASAVVCQATRGRQPHPPTTADDNGRRICQP
jgi:hypothetical protein